MKYFEKAKDYYISAYNNRIKFDDGLLPLYISDFKVLQYLSKCYFKMEEFETSRKILQKQLVSTQFNLQPYEVSSTLRRLSNLDFYLGDIDRAGKLLLKYKNYKMIDSNSFQVNFYNSLAYYFYRKNLIDSAIKYQKLSVRPRLEFKEKTLIISTYVTLGRYYLEKQNLDSASKYFSIARRYFESDVNKNFANYYHENYSKYLLAIGDTIGYKNSKHLALSISNQKKLLNKQFKNTKRIIEKDRELESANKDFKFLLTITILFLLLIIIVVWLLIRKRKNEKVLNQKTLILDEEIKSHIETHKNFEWQLSQKNKLIGLISHDLINPLGASANLLEMAEDLVDKENTELLEILVSIRTSILRNKKMLRDIMTWIMSTEEKYDRSPQIMDVYHSINSVYEMLKPQLDTKKLHFQNNSSITDKCWVDPYHFEAIIRNLIQNSIKFTKSEGEIMVDSYTEGNFLFIDVSDNGIGIDEENISQLFDTKRLILKEHTKNSSGYGYGLIIIKEFMALNKGDIFVSSKKGQGTKFTLKFPKQEYE